MSWKKKFVKQTREQVQGEIDVYKTAITKARKDGSSEKVVRGLAYYLRELFYFKRMFQLEDND